MPWRGKGASELAFKPHLSHLSLNSRSIHDKAFSPQLDSHPPRTVIGMGCIDLIDPVLQGKLLQRSLVLGLQLFQRLLVILEDQSGIPSKLSLPSRQLMRVDPTVRSDLGVDEGKLMLLYLRRQEGELLAVRETPGRGDFQGRRILGSCRQKQEKRKVLRYGWSRERP